MNRFKLDFLFESVMFVRYLFFMLINILLFPITIIGQTYLGIKIILKAKKMGTSVTAAADPLGVRWLLHYSGVRIDDECEKLLEGSGFKVNRIRKVGNFGCLFDAIK